MSNPIKSFGDIFKRTGSEVVEFIFHYLGGKAVDKVVDGAVNTVISKPLESNLWGAGTDDEALAVNALVHAALEQGADPKGIDRIMKVTAGLPLSRRRRFITIVGKRESVITITLPTKKTATGKAKKNSTPSKATTNINIDGANFFLYLSTKSKKQIETILTGMKLTDTPADSIKETYETIVSALTKVEADTKIISTIDGIAGKMLKELKKTNNQKSWLRRKFYRH